MQLARDAHSDDLGDGPNISSVSDIINTDTTQKESPSIAADILDV